MKKMTKTEMLKLIDVLRAIAPHRPLTYGESLQVARIQAATLRKLVKANEAEMNLIWLLEQKAVPVHLAPSHELNEESGLTTDLIGDKLQMFVNKNEPPVRQRFTLLHEFKHVLDFKDAKTLHSKLGTGDEQRKANQIEWIANEFAGQALMPVSLVKRIWFMTQDLTLSASMFNVSREAMQTRLQRLNLIGESVAHPRGYFRNAGLIADSNTSPLAYVA
ncbi:hypothetical protein GCM10018980_40190 [Streptomyces capoamus]|uniref:IrrE N-terminal-like domain-containing protein n=1 Tax=Streptomyces capoamus TaxID=68183 RepID=A0A919C8Q8_9ACTN|nr:ImmA/IrrE family metallo-endopeptidase [Streptomyces capoamus]GGW15148.1 hypothetical protein GCM10010501_26000 [Streptomyces libani subsp. rufus]GHG55035.1 hypothetical protein GCM10018980_40190 [Streptomyces capoamus]